MLPKKEVVAMLLAGGQGSRLGVLTKKIDLPFLSEENTESLISHCPTVQIQVLRLLVF